MNHNFFSNLNSKLESIALIEEDNNTVAGEDIIRVNVPAFLRIVELVREEIQDDVPLHRLTEILSRLSKTDTITMEDYEAVYQYTMQDTDHTAQTTEARDRSPGKIDKDEDPCWKGYHMVGTKKKNGREVPNCVPGKKG